MNGTSEAFLHAVATENQLKRSNDSLLVFSVIYIVLNVLLIRSAGAVGLILANSLNMVLRIIYSTLFIKRYFQDSSFSFSSCLPSGWKVLLFSGVTTLISEKIFLDRKNFWPTFFIHFSIGLACFCVSSFVIYRRERPFINKIIRFRDHSDWRTDICPTNLEQKQERVKAKFKNIFFNENFRNLFWKKQYEQELLHWKALEA